MFFKNEEKELVVEIQVTSSKQKKVKGTALRIFLSALELGVRT
jgi:hypothetical protein